MKTNNEKIKYFAYVRKSSEDKERQALSIPTQKEKLEAQFPDLDIEFIAEEKSAFKPYNRPDFEGMMKRIDKGERRGLIAWHPDRLSRNEVDASAITYRIRTGAIQDLKIASYHFENTPEGIWMLQMALSQSQYESAKKGRDVKRGLEKKRKMGWLPGVAKPGYLNTPDLGKGFKIIVKDPIRFPMVREMWDKMLTGNFTPPRILEIANKEWHYKTVQRKNEGGNPMSRSQIYKIFTDPFYYGYFEFPVGSGEWVKGEHEPMITEEEYQRVQAILGKRGKPAPKRHLFAFTGLMKCGSCQSSITAEEKFKHQKNGNVHHYIYYHCTKKKNPDCLEKCIEVKELERQIDGALEGITISEEFKNWAIKYLHEIRTNEATTQHIAFQNKQKELASATEQLGSLLLKFTSTQNTNGQLFSDSEYQEAKKGLLKRKESLELELQGQGKQMEQWLELSEKTFNFARYARIWFQKGDVETRRAILSCLGSNPIVEGGKLRISLRPVFQTIFDNELQAGQEIVSARTSQNSPNKRKNGALVSVCPSWLRRQDSNLQPSR
jgi:site-specific DNA recombinase